MSSYRIFWRLLFSTLLYTAAFADEEPDRSRPFLNGHNLTITSYVLPPGLCTSS